MRLVIGVLCISVLLFCLLLPAGSLAGAARYKYDGAGRLISVQYDNGVTVKYTYDQMGNRLTETVRSGGAAEDEKSKPESAAENDDNG
jgi:YD repeat-containing protein